MKKRFLTFFLTLVAGVGTMFAWDYERVQIGDLCYNLNASNQTAEVTYMSDINDDFGYFNEGWAITIASIPASVTYNEISYSVTSIGEFAFAGCSGLTSVTIPNSVTSIGYAAFRDCSGLASVTIGNSVTSIGNGAFEDCESLPVINNCRYADTYLVEAVDRELSTYIIRNGTKWIGSKAFKGCSNLTSITIPNSVIGVGDYAFEYCRALTSVTIPNSVTSIGSGAFYYCTGLTSIVVENGNSVYDSRSNCNAIIEMATNILIVGCRNTIIPNSVTSIGSSAFSGCSSLTSVTIGNSVTNIGNSAFSGCSGLTSVTIPNSVTSIGESAFKNCSGMASVTIGNSVTSIGNGAFEDCESLPVINNCRYADTYLVEAVDRELSTYIIRNGTKWIGSKAFKGCSNLTSITIPNSVIGVGDYAFEYCRALTSVTIPNSVISIGERAFADCTGLTSITIPNSTTNIWKGAFRYCIGLNSVTNYATTPQIVGDVFYVDTYDNQDIIEKRCKLYVPKGSIDAYKISAEWKGFGEILPIGAQPVEVTTTTVTSSETTADIAWPKVNGAASYELVIKDKNGNVVCTLIFDAEGHLTSLTFNAPARNNAPQQTQAAGFSFTVTSLGSGTTYSYTITAKGNNGNVLKTESGTFTTTGEPQGIEDVQNEQGQGSKILHNGQIFILRGEKVYTLTGQEVK